MKIVPPFTLLGASVALTALFGAFVPALQAQAATFHKAPAETAQTKNPLAGQPAATAGRHVYEQNCLACHGANVQGSGNIPALREGLTQTASDGSIFWYITQGDLNNGMPSWAKLPEEQRWQVISYLKSLGAAAPSTSPAAAALAEPPAAAAVSTAPPPPA